MDIYSKAIDFGNPASKHSFIVYVFRMILFIIPAIVVSHLLDETMNHLYSRYDSSTYLTILLVLIQTFFMVAALYFFITYFNDFSSEFQSTAPGGFFIAIFYGFQPYYFKHLKTLLRMLYSL